MHALHQQKSCHNKQRSGAAAVEFALVAPLFLVIVLGISEFGTAIHAHNSLTSAVREGGRLASMDFSSYVTPSQSANDKVIRDIRAFLTASGMPGSQVEITITDVETGATFDLSDQANYLRLFRIHASVPYSEISVQPIAYLSGHVIEAQMVYRRGRVQMVQ